MGKLAPDIDTDDGKMTLIAADKSIRSVVFWTEKITLYIALKKNVIL